MKARSLPWLTLHVLVLVAGSAQLVALIGSLPEALETPYGTGGVLGRLVWVILAIAVAKKLHREYSSDANSGTPLGNPAFVSTTMRPPSASPASPFECDAIAPPPTGSAAWQGTVPAHGAILPSRGSVPPPRA